ncbi:uncharacterized protein NEMAJ01_2188 [Nematocida major]|uniref:uncharacterized protein n=1 Tax=Nematocida major TaxID=1912982 RepID=UPI00200866A8|nr:uncharacterized protein NEMAJ01_2188 [Nematocida major]KAH9387292.1 hypothetical protein NEMAJ01_2188 [Nematocida major]
MLLLKMGRMAMLVQNLEFGWMTFRPIFSMESVQIEYSPSHIARPNTISRKIGHYPRPVYLNMHIEKILRCMQESTVVFLQSASLSEHIILDERYFNCRGTESLNCQGMWIKRVPISDILPEVSPSEKATCLFVSIPKKGRNGSSWRLNYIINDNFLYTSAFSRRKNGFLSIDMEGSMKWLEFSVWPSPVIIATRRSLPNVMVSMHISEYLELTKSMESAGLCHPEKNISMILQALVHRISKKVDISTPQEKHKKNMAVLHNIYTQQISPLDSNQGYNIKTHVMIKSQEFRHAEDLLAEKAYFETLLSEEEDCRECTFKAKRRAWALIKNELMHGEDGGCLALDGNSLQEVYFIPQRKLPSSEWRKTLFSENILSLGRTLIVLNSSSQESEFPVEKERVFTLIKEKNSERVEVWSHAEKDTDSVRVYNACSEEFSELLSYIFHIILPIPSGLWCGSPSEYDPDALSKDMLAVVA